MWLAKAFRLLLNTLNGHHSRYQPEARQCCYIHRAVIQTVANPRGNSAQYIVRHIIEKYNSLEVPTEIHWIPAHAGVPGNEIADMLAKEATGSRHNPIDNTRGIKAQPPRIPLRPLHSAARAKIKDNTKLQWARLWEDPERGPKLKHLSDRPSKETMNRHRGLQQHMSSILTQMRTGKIGLNNYLNCIKAADSPACSCDGESWQTLSHILLDCADHEELRRQTPWISGTPRQRDLRTILKEPTLAKKAAWFMLQTKLLRQFREIRQSEQCKAGDGPPREYRSLPLLQLPELDKILGTQEP
jgi:hypothetical protein